MLKVRDLKKYALASCDNKSTIAILASGLLAISRASSHLHSHHVKMDKHNDELIGLPSA